MWDKKKKISGQLVTSAIEWGVVGGMLRKRWQGWLVMSAVGKWQGRCTRERVLNQLVMSAMSTGWGNFFMVMSTMEMEWWQVPEGLEQNPPWPGIWGEEGMGCSPSICHPWPTGNQDDMSGMGQTGGPSTRAAIRLVSVWVGLCLGPHDLRHWPWQGFLG